MYIYLYICISLKRCVFFKVLISWMSMFSIFHTVSTPVLSDAHKMEVQIFCFIYFDFINIYHCSDSCKIGEGSYANWFNTSAFNNLLTR